MWVSTSITQSWIFAGVVLMLLLLGDGDAGRPGVYPAIGFR
jgi:hypothetical protein